MALETRLDDLQSNKPNADLSSVIPDVALVRRPLHPHLPPPIEYVKLINGHRRCNCSEFAIGIWKLKMWSKQIKCDKKFMIWKSNCGLLGRLLPLMPSCYTYIASNSKQFMEEASAVNWLSPLTPVRLMLWLYDLLVIGIAEVKGLMSHNTMSQFNCLLYQLTSFVLVIIAC